jgi:AcrR family transcriptional regulator
MSRKDLIINIARKVIVENGLYDASIGKIAKEADIPVGSVYTYFKSKEELVNEIYIQAKGEMNDFIFIPLPKALSEKDELNIYWQRAIEFALNNPEKFSFSEQFINSPLIFKHNQEAVNRQFGIAYDLMERGVRNQILKNLPLDILQTLVYSHLLGVIKFFRTNPSGFTPEIAQQLFETCWDSIKR